MVQMHPLSSTTSVTYEAEGGIRNPACQDDDSTESKSSTRQQQQQQQQQRHRPSESTREAEKRNGTGEPYKIHEKGQELKETMTVCRTRVPWRFSFNFVLAITVSLVIILAEFGYIPNQQTGFFCNDPKLSHKFKGDTISAAVLIAVTVFLPALVIWLTEWTCYSSESYKSLDCASSSRSRQFWQWYGFYTIGWWYMIFIVEIMKITVGEPRPHFIDSCRPKEMENCTNEFKISYTCTNTELSRFDVKDSDKSFPSGHSALSMFTAAYLVWYLQIRMPEWLTLMLVKPWLQCLALLWGLGCAMSRITDHRHHWWDVLVGAGIGLCFAAFVARVPCRGFRAGSKLGLGKGQAALEALRANGPGAPGYPGPGKRHQSGKKLLSQSSIEPPEDRELGDMPAAWNA